MNIEQNKYCIVIYVINIVDTLTCFILFIFFRANGEMKHDATDDDSEEENEEGDYTVYECPGLAPVSTYTLIQLFQCFTYYLDL